MRLVPVEMYVLPPRCGVAEGTVTSPRNASWKIVSEPLPTASDMLLAAIARFVRRLSNLVHVRDVLISGHEVSRYVPQF